MDNNLKGVFENIIKYANLNKFRFSFDDKTFSHAVIKTKYTDPINLINKLYSNKMYKPEQVEINREKIKAWYPIGKGLGVEFLFYQ